MNWALLQNSLLVAGTTTALAAGFGLVAALWLAALGKPWRNLFLALAVVALALPPFLVTNCWLDLLGATGVWRSWLPFDVFSLNGSVLILSLLLWPISTLLVLNGWRRLEAEQLECDPALTGFSLLRVLLLPMARGELSLAAVLTFVLALNNFAVPAILQTKVLPDDMWIRFNTQFDTLGALKAGLPLIVAPVVLLLLFWRRAIVWPRSQGAVPARIFRRQLGAVWFGLSGATMFGLCVVSVGVPLGQIAFARRTWTELPGAVEAGTSAIWSSFWFAAVAATIVVAVALVFRRSRHKEAHSPKSVTSQSLLTSAATVIGWLPFFIPGVLIGIVLIKIFNRPVLAAFYQSAGIVLLAFVIRYFALGWTAVRHALGSVDSDLIDVARLEGATRWQMWRHVWWPQTSPQILAVWYVVYLLCLWDVESMILVEPPGGETLALRIFNLLHYGHAAQVNALCVTLLGLAVLPLAVWCVWTTASKISGNTKHQTPSAGNSFGVWCLNFLWCLVVGVLGFCSGCSPRLPANEGPLHSKFFERAVVIGTRGVGIGEFNKPRSVAVDLQDNMYAVDITARVQKFSPEGKFLLDWQFQETSKGKPKGMGRDHEGNIIVVEPHYQRINHFTTDGKLVARWGCTGTNVGCFAMPRSVAVNSRGEIFVSEYTGEERVQKFALPPIRTSEVSSNTRPHPGPLPQERENDLRSHETSVQARLLQVIGKAGTGPGEFNRAEGICVDAQDRLYVADSCNHRIQIFSSDGKFIRQYGKPGSGLGELSYPYDICVDAQGSQFVCEFGNSRIQVFDTNCQPVEIIGGPGAEPGRFANPWSLALDSHGNLYVADSQNHRVQKLIRRHESKVSGLKSSPMVARVELQTSDSRLQTVPK